MTRQKVALVTGASGFVGTALCRRLRALGWRVIGLARMTKCGPWDSFVAHEMGSGIIPVTEALDAVFHLAARTHWRGETGRDREEYFRTNVGGMSDLLRTLEERGSPRVIFASSVKASGESTPPEGIDEDEPSKPATSYGESKLAAEKLLLSSRQGKRSTVLRLAMVYGCGQKGNLAEMIRAVARRRFPPLPEVHNRRSAVHVEDVVDALISAAHVPISVCGGRTYYISGGRAHSSREIYTAICLALGRRMPSWSVPPAALRTAGWAGDLVGWATQRRFLWDSDRYEKLFGSAHYRCDRAALELGVKPARDLTSEMSNLVRDALESAGN